MIPTRILTALLTVGCLVALGGGSARAQAVCTGQAISNASLSNLLNNHYACVGSSPNASWNELHTSGYVLDYKMGPPATGNNDPSDTLAHPTGSYGTTGGTTGLVTYTYGSSSFGYNVYQSGTGTVTATTFSAGTFSFCTTTGGQNLLVTVQAAHC